MSSFSSRLRASFSVVAAGLLLTTSAAFAAPQYKATAIGPYPDLYFPEAYGLNDAGRVTGYVRDGTNVAFAWQEGQLTTLGLPPGALASGGYGINNVGVIAGGISSGFSSDAVIWSNGQIQVLPRLPGASYAGANAINDAGQIAGSSDVHAVTWQSGQIFKLPSLGNEKSSTVIGINAAGTMVGTSTSLSFVTRALVWKNDQVEQLSSGAYRGAGALDVNIHDTVVGYVEKDGSPEQAARWDNGQLSLLDNLASSISTRAFAINDGGLAVGASFGIHNSDATLWVGTKAWSLKSLVINSDGWDLWQAKDINESGQIVGFGTLNGAPVSFLLTPVPEASTMALTLIGLLAMVAAARRKAGK